MYFYNKKEVRDQRRLLRNNATTEERKLWQYLRNSSLGYKFRRQHSIGPYIVDFCCPSQRIIIELDGNEHKSNRQYDENRTTLLEQAGYIVLRFWNYEVRDNITQVLDKIKSHCDRV